MYGTFSTNRLYHAIEVLGNVSLSHRAGENTITKEYNKPTQS